MNGTGADHEKHEGEKGKFTLKLTSDVTPKAVKLWTADAATKDFRKSKWTSQSLKAGKEPSAAVCGRPTTGRVVATPSQWGLSLFKTWRF